MKFSQRSEYGVRLMVDLARNFGRGPISLAEVARAEDLSQTFLEQIIMPLRRAGLVRSRHGVRGGYELSRPPQEIRMGDVLRVLEGSLAPMFCVSGTSDRDICALEDHCGTQILWARVRDGINQALDATSLADLTAPRGRYVGASTLAMVLPMARAPEQCAEYQPAVSP